MKSNYTIVHTYATIVNDHSRDPICVSIYEFVSNDLRMVNTPILGLVSE